MNTRDQRKHRTYLPALNAHRFDLFQMASFIQPDSVASFLAANKAFVVLGRVQQEAGDSSAAGTDNL